MFLRIIKKVISAITWPTRLILGLSIFAYVLFLVLSDIFSTTAEQAKEVRDTAAVFSYPIDPISRLETATSKIVIVAAHEVHKDNALQFAGTTGTSAALVARVGVHILIDKATKI